MAFGGEVMRPGSPEGQDYLEYMVRFNAHEAPSVFLPSAEGITTFAGAEADTDGKVRKWLDKEVATIGQEHAFNQKLPEIRRGMGLED